MSCGRICVLFLVISMSLSALPILATGPVVGGSPYDAPPVSRGAAADGWPAYMADANHTGHVSVPIPMDNSTLWSTTIPGLKATNSPIVSGNMAFIGSGDTKVRGVDIDTGKIVWTASSTGQVSGGLAVRDGDLFFGSDDGYAYSFDIATKARNWRVKLEATSIPSSPTVIDGMVLIGTHNLTFSKFYALDPLNGDVLWYLTMDGTENSWGFKSSAAAYGDRIYVGDGAGTLYCLDRNGFWNGNDGITTEPDPSRPFADVVWQATLDTSIIGSPMLAEGNVFIGSSAGYYYKLNASDGTQLYKTRLGNGEWPSLSTTPAYYDGVVYVTCKRDMGMGVTGGSVFALDASTDEQMWRYNITKTIIESSPVITDEYLFFAARDSKIYCLRTDPEWKADRLFWKKDLGSPITSTAAIANGRIFVARPDPYGDGKLIAFGTPDPYVDGLIVSDPFMLEGEVVEFTAHLRNNGTVATTCEMLFTATTADFKAKTVFARPNGIVVGAYGETDVTVSWRAEQSFPIIDASISSSVPGNRITDNDFRSMEVFVGTQISGYWTSAGGGPGRDSSAQKGVDSNRTLWEKGYSFGWTDDPEGLWFDSFGGTGSAASIGSTVFFVDPDGGLTALYHEEGASEPSISWRYRNASVKFLGRPALQVDRDQSQAFPNKVFVYGDDGCLWAFDWIGFQDGRNDGPYTQEGAKGSENGDVLWRTQLPRPPDSPLTVAASNVLLRDEGGMVLSYDDDTGRLAWSFDAGVDAPFASTTWDVAVGWNGSVLLLDAGFGTVGGGIPLQGIVEGDIVSLAAREGRIVVTYSTGLALVDIDPDDNGDGKLDKKDLDEGVPDNLSLGRDIIWNLPLPEGPSTPPAIDGPGDRVAICSGSVMSVVGMLNGTVMAELPLGAAPSGRIVAGGGSFYATVGASPWTILAFQGKGQGTPEEVWSIDLNGSGPMGEPALSAGVMILSLGEGRMVAIGALNTAPVAMIGRPLPGMLVFPDELIQLDAGGSYDPQGDPLTYRWYIDGQTTPLYEGPSPRANVTVQGIGKVRLVLRVLDDMRAYGEDSVNVTVLKRITEPDHVDYIYDVRIHMSYGISDPNGRGYVTLTSPEGAPSDHRIIFLMDLDFKLLQQYALYKFEYANITVSLSGKEFPLRMENSRLGIFMRDEDTGIWDRAPGSGYIPQDGTVYGNFTTLDKGTYAMGILDNRVPDLRHRGNGEDIEKAITGSGYTFKVEYRDLDGDDPALFKMVVDNETTYGVANDGFLVDHRTFNYFQASPVVLRPGTHSYYFEVSDGSFTVKSRYYQIEIDNQRPVVVLHPPIQPVSAGKVALFDASDSYDPDGEVVEFSWDFDSSNGIQREDVRGKVDHIYYEVGVYTVTLTVSDGVESTVREITVTVIADNAANDRISQTTLFLLLLAFVAILGVALGIFLVLTRKGKEQPTGEEHDIGWTCPECGVRARRGSPDCDRCGYEYDPNDFPGAAKSGAKSGYLDGE